MEGEGSKAKGSLDSLPKGVTRDSRPLSHLCPVCGDKVEDLKVPRGNPQIYCSPMCRTRAWRFRKETKQNVKSQLHSDRGNDQKDTRIETEDLDNQGRKHSSPDGLS